MIKAETNENGEVNFEVTGRYCDIAKELVVVESHIYRSIISDMQNAKTKEAKTANIDESEETI